MRWNCHRDQCFSPDLATLASVNISGAATSCQQEVKVFRGQRRIDIKKLSLFLLPQLEWACDNPVILTLTPGAKWACGMEQRIG